MRGIQFIYDNQGNKTSAVVDLRRYGKEFAVFLDQLAKQTGEVNDTNTTTTTTTTNNNPVIGDTMNVIGNNNTINARKIKIDALLKTARSFYGVPYRTGGVSESGMDCSGFTQTSFKSIGIELPRVSKDQTLVGQPVEKASLQPGDLVFFATGTPDRVNHVGIVTDSSNINDIKFIHASTSKGVMEAGMGLDYWVKAYMTGRRVV